MKPTSPLRSARAPRLYWSSSLFNEVYLEQDIPRLYKFWVEDDLPAFQQFYVQFQNLCEALKDQKFEKWNEAETVKDWIIPIMELLGWHDKCGPRANPVSDNVSFTITEGGRKRSYRPDLIYVDDPSEKQFLRDEKGAGDIAASRAYCKMIVEAKSWERLDELGKIEVDQTKGTGSSKDKEDDTRALEPEEQCLKYMTILRRDFGILTDGKRWRLLHRELSEGSNRRCFEFNLGHARRAVLSGLDRDKNGVAWNEFIEGLKYFFYFFNKQAFYPTNGSQPFIEEVLEYSKKYASDIEEDLKASFIDAMTIVCNSYRDVVGRKLTAPEVDIVRSVSESHLFNLLFIKSCEVRGILPTKNPNYIRLSITEIIDTIDYPKFNPAATDEFNERKLAPLFSTFKYSSNGTELYDRIIKLYSVVHDGDFGLQIAGFRETVFEKKEWDFAAKHKLPNKDVARLLFTLGYTKAPPGEPRKFQQIPYNFFTARQLGSIYESFLEYSLLEADTDLVYTDSKWTPANLRSVTAQEQYAKCPQVHKGDLYFAFDTSSRKETGSYYTPDYVVRYIIDKTVGPLVEGKSSKEIANLKVCDPAMGSGHFLNVVLEYITDAYREALSREVIDDLKENYAESSRHILHSCIFGVDINPRAVKLAKMGLWLASAHPNRKLERLDDQLQCADSLLEAETILSNWKPQAFVGNPPYINVFILASNPKYKEELRAKYKSARGAFDICALFIEACRKSKVPNRIGFILPNKLASVDNAEAMRSFIRDDKQLFVESVDDISHLDVFEDAAVYPMILILGSTDPGKVAVSHHEKSFDALKKPALVKPEYQRDTWLSELLIKDKSAAIESIPLGDVCEICAAATVDEAYTFRSAISDEKSKGDIKFIVSGNIVPFYTTWGIQKTQYLGKSYKKPWFDLSAKGLTDRRKALYKSEKVIIPNMTKTVRAFYDDGEFVSGISTTFLLDSKVPMKALAAYINTSLATKLYRELFDSMHLNGDALRIGAPELKKLPVPASLLKDKTLQKRAVELYDKINEAIVSYLKAGGKPSALKKALDARSLSPETKVVIDLVTKLDKLFADSTAK